MRRLDLDRQRDWRDLLYDTGDVWLRHAPVFLVLAAVFAAPVGLLDLPLAGVEILGTLVLPGLVMATHAAAVLELGAGRRPSILQSLGVALRRVPLVLATQALYLLAVAAGLLALIVPGVYLAVSLYFGPLVAVAERTTPVAALRRSHALVAPQWPRVFLLVFFIGLVAPTAGLVGFAVGDVVGWTITSSLAALAATLLFFDLRARSAID